MPLNKVTSLLVTLD